MNATDTTLWGFVVMMTVSLVGGWFAHRALEKAGPDKDESKRLVAPGAPESHAALPHA